jgi:hypothetical protein
MDSNYPGVETPGLYGGGGLGSRNLLKGFWKKDTIAIIGRYL